MDVSMKMEVIRIDGPVVTCQLADGHILDIDKKWLDKDIKEGDELEFSVVKK